MLTRSIVPTKKDTFTASLPVNPRLDKFFGLYERVGVKRKKGGTKLKKIFTTGNKSRPIRRLFPARDIAYRYARQRIMFEFNKALKQAERTRRA